MEPIDPRDLETVIGGGLLGKTVWTLASMAIGATGILYLQADADHADLPTLRTPGEPDPDQKAKDLKKITQP